MGGQSKVRSDFLPAQTSSKNQSAITLDSISYILFDGRHTSQEQRQLPSTGEGEALHVEVVANLSRASRDSHELRPDGDACHQIELRGCEHYQSHDKVR